MSENMRDEFIHKIAEYLAYNAAGKSISLAVETAKNPPIRWAHEWQSVREASPVFGYVSVEEAEKVLHNLLDQTP